jgi:hypothetical protein
MAPLLFATVQPTNSINIYISASYICCAECVGALQYATQDAFTTLKRVGAQILLWYGFKLFVPSRTYRLYDLSIAPGAPGKRREEDEAIQERR